MMSNNKYTPETIACGTTTFSIPLYQRLFEWDKEQITQLLNDLYSGFDHKRDEPYYIGMLTTHKNDLVDGQQRFTVLMLMAIAFKSGNNKWGDFLNLKDGGRIRLLFYARKNDEKYLLAKVNDEKSIDYKNANMESGIKCITDFVDKLEKREEFINYVFCQLTFFISELHTDYQPHDLNKYFEAMNADGRGLENHEILKVNLLKFVSNEKQTEYTKIWNAVADMDKLLIRSKYINKIQEDKNKLNERQLSALAKISNTQELFKECNACSAIDEKPLSSDTIKGIEPTSVPPKGGYRSIGERAILSFPEFLLQVLCLQISEEDQKRIPNFFNVHKLQETFEHLKRDTKEVELFFENLLKYRLLFDYFIIKISSKEDNSTSYTLAFMEDESNSFDREKLIKFQSMLYVSTSTNIWLSKALKYLSENVKAVDANSFYNELIFSDNNYKGKDIKLLSLKYGEIDRYWFWRLDYYLWYNEVQKSKLNRDESIVEYSFKANRSIEHLHAQSAINKWSEKEESELLNSFGNLAMISPGFNSTQSNDVENVKFQRVVNQMKSKNLLESIKMLLMYQKATQLLWTPKLAIEHGNEMIDILIDSFPEDGYDDIRDKLKKQKIEMTQL